MSNDITHSFIRFSNAAQTTTVELCLKARTIYWTVIPWASYTLLVVSVYCTSAVQVQVVIFAARANASLGTHLGRVLVRSPNPCGRVRAPNPSGLVRSPNPRRPVRSLYRPRSARRSRVDWSAHHIRADRSARQTRADHSARQLQGAPIFSPPRCGTVRGAMIWGYNNLGGVIIIWEGVYIPGRLQYKLNKLMRIKRNWWKTKISKGIEEKLRKL